MPQEWKTKPWQAKEKSRWRFQNRSPQRSNSSYSPSESPIPCSLSFLSSIQVTPIQVTLIQVMTLGVAHAAGTLRRRLEFKRAAENRAHARRGAHMAGCACARRGGARGNDGSRLRGPTGQSGAVGPVSLDLPDPCRSCDMVAELLPPSSRRLRSMSRDPSKMLLLVLSNV